MGVSHYEWEVVIMAIVNGYDAYAINPDILSEYNVDQSGEVVSAEIWKALWDLVLGALIKYDRAFIDIYRTLADLNAELDSCIQRVDRIEKIYDALAERMATLEKTWTQLQDTYNKIAGHYEDIKNIHDALKEGLVHYGVDAPTLKYTKLWVMPTQFPLSPLRDVVNTIITSRTDSELNANSENPVQNKAIVRYLGALKTEIQGNLDEIGDIIGGDGATEEGVLWSASLNKFTPFGVESGLYTALYTGKLPAIKSGAYKFEINNEVVDGLVTAREGITEISAYLQDMGQIDLVFGAAAGSVFSATELTNIDIKILKTNEVVDYWLYVGSPHNNHQRTLTLCLPASYGFVVGELVSPDDLATGKFKITIATNDGSVSWNPGWATYLGTDSTYPNMVYFGDNSVISAELENALKNNTPVTVTISQENGITKVITDNYVVGNRYINNEYAAAYEQDVYYRWGNGGLLLTGSLLGS